MKKSYGPPTRPLNLKKSIKINKNQKNQKNHDLNQKNRSIFFTVKKSDFLPTLSPGKAAVTQYH